MIRIVNKIQEYKILELGINETKLEWVDYIENMSSRRGKPH